MNLKNSCFKTTASSFGKKMRIPTSKSFANRALVLAAISTKEIILNEVPESTDVLNMITCLREIGLDIKTQGTSVKVINSFPECEIENDKVIDLKTGDGGTTNRFLIPLLALGSNSYNLIASEMMVDRPMDELDETLTDMGVRVQRDEQHWFKLQGPYQINKHVIEVDCARSTQFATGLALSLSKINVDIEPVNLRTSRPYWDMTVNLIEMFEENCVFDVPVDFSSLSYPLALGILSEGVLVQNCKGVDRYQADSALIYILEQVGAHFEFLQEGLKLSKFPDLPAINVDCRNCPDLVPTLCFLASYANGESFLENVNVLKHKECDRLEEMLKMMDAFGVKARYCENDDALIIQGRKPHSSNVDYDPPVDHRMVMVCYLFQRYNGGGTLTNAHCVDKSFPSFFEAMG